MNLKHIEINIWKACNNKCIFCMSWNSRPIMLKLADFWYIKERLRKYIDEWYNSVWYLGWDISIHPRIIDIISYSKEIWFLDINIITNWMLFSNYDFAEKVILAGATRINFSIHSHIDNIEDYITKVPWWLQKKIKAIKNFQLLQKQWFLKSNLSMNLVLNKLNLENIVETLLFFSKKIWINDIRINFIWLADSWWLIKNWKELSITYLEFLPYLKQIIYISLKYNIRITFDTVPPCIFAKIDKNNIQNIINNFLWEQFDIINKIEHVNIINEKEQFNWKEKKKKILKTKFEKCKECKYDEMCEWIWKEYNEIYWNFEIYPIK